MSAPRAMQGTAMGMLYLMNGLGQLILLLLMDYVKFEPTDTARQITYLINGCAAGSLVISSILLPLTEKRYNLGLSWI